MTKRGFVSIVGAGPGDPALLTRKAAACLRSADLILYDALVDPRTLTLGRRARKFFVGKRLGRHQMTQRAIEALMVRAARRGLRVVRLKGGDPFVFGRGGEEALALRAARVPFEVVPGITSAVAAPAAAGIPVTHRGFAAGFLVVSGHDARAFDAAIQAVRPNGLTLVVMMGLANRSDVADVLIERGWSRATPAAVVFGAWTSDARTWRGTLAELSTTEEADDLAGTIVVGNVASLTCAPYVETARSVSELEAEASRHARIQGGIGARG